VRKFCSWFLKERSTRYILRGNMVDKPNYLKYKNHVMMKYIE